MQISVTDYLDQQIGRQSPVGLVLYLTAHAHALLGRDQTAYRGIPIRRLDAGPPAVLIRKADDE